MPTTWAGGSENTDRRGVRFQMGAQNSRWHAGGRQAEWVDGGKMEAEWAHVGHTSYCTPTIT